MPLRRAYSSETFAEIAEVIGEAGARLLCDHLGGTTIYVPAQIGHHHPIGVAIGAQLAKMLATHFCGSHLQLPKAYLRRGKVLELKAQTQMTVAEIALACDYCERQIYNILADAGGGADGDDTAQMDLFGRA
jgi:hypothetical protein